MKIEKLNDRQIRCTLTREDLSSRQIRLSDLAYGTEKTRRLFQEMMQQASAECGFEAEDFPLMIEAVPLSMESIMLIITKVENADELDMRFSNFSDFSDEEEEPRQEPENPLYEDHTNEIIELFERILKEKNKREADTSSQKSPEKAAGEADREELVKMFSFRDLDTAFTLSHLLRDFYTGDNALYKDVKNQSYHLVIRQGGHTLSEFYKVYNTVAEYTTPENYTPGGEAYFKEHCRTLIAHGALQELSKGSAD